MADYSDDILSAYNDIVEAGTTIQIIQSASGGTFNPVTETYARATTLATFTHPAVITKFEESFIDDTQIQKGDRQFLIPGLKNDLSTMLVLKQSDRVYWNSKYWSIVNENPVAPDGTPIIYKVHCRE